MGMGSINHHQCVHHHQVQVQRKRKSSMKKLNFNDDHGDHGDHGEQEDQDRNQEDRDNNNNNRHVRHRHVQFATIDIRTHSLCIGDNPGGVSGRGCPISLDWEYDTEHESYNLDEYEEKLNNNNINNMIPKRINSIINNNNNISNSNKLNHWQLILQPFEREFILIHKLGYTKEEIEVQRKKIKKDRRQRKHTRRIMILEPIEIGIEQFRKWRNKRNKKSNNNNNNNGKKTMTKDESSQQPPFIEDCSNTSMSSSSASTSLSCCCQENK
jgi:hypothetical protein